MGPGTIRNLVRAVSCKGCRPIVRVPEVQRSYVQWALDAGAEGVLFPQVSTAAEAEAAVRFCRYPPDGIRGLGPSRATQYGFQLKEYEARANQDLAVLIQIENESALDNLDAILSVSGIDLAFIGPGDLSQALGVTGQLAHPRVLETMERVVDACHAHQVPAGTLELNPDAWSHWLERGVHTLMVGSDLFYLANGATSAVERFRSVAASEGPIET